MQLPCCQVATPDCTDWGGLSHRFIGKCIGVSWSLTIHLPSEKNGPCTLAHLFTKPAMKTQTHSCILVPILGIRGFMSAGFDFSPFPISGQKLGASWSAQRWSDYCGYCPGANSAEEWVKEYGGTDLLTLQKPQGFQCLWDSIQPGLCRTGFSPST